MNTDWLPAAALMCLSFHPEASHCFPLSSQMPVPIFCLALWEKWGAQVGALGDAGPGGSKKKSNPIIGEWNHFTQMSMSQRWQATGEITLQRNIERRRPPPRPTHIKWIYLWLLKCCSYKDVSLPSKINLFPLLISISKSYPIKPWRKTVDLWDLYFKLY